MKNHNETIDAPAADAKDQFLRDLDAAELAKVNGGWMTCEQCNIPCYQLCGSCQEDSGGWYW